jgi:hypothetical protein
VTVTLILTWTCTLTATRSRRARRPLIWSVSAVSRADCTDDCGPLWSQCSLDLCFVIWIWVWHGGLRGCGAGSVARLAIGCGRVLFLLPGLAQILGSCARHCHRSACAAWMADPRACPPAQDPTWRCDLCVTLSSRSVGRMVDPEVVVELKQAGLRREASMNVWRRAEKTWPRWLAYRGGGRMDAAAGISSAAKARGSLVTS